MFPHPATSAALARTTGTRPRRRKAMDARARGETTTRIMRSPRDAHPRAPARRCAAAALFCSAGSAAAVVATRGGPLVDEGLDRGTVLGGLVRECLRGGRQVEQALQREL